MAAEGGAAKSGAAAGGVQQAVGTREWAFPRDHGQHPAYRLEWWYYTGNLRGADGRRFGFQVTFFRRSLHRGAAPRSSAWAVESLYLAHIALSDIGRRRFFHESRMARDSLELAGAARDAHRVWLEPWRATPLADDPHGVALDVDGEAFGLHLRLRALRPPLLHGQGGLDQKGPAPGQASWYYSLPRLEVTGRLSLEGAGSAVEGLAWMDHEFGSGQLGAELAGWDWFALQLSDGSDLMLYRLRRRDGSAGPFSGGTLLAPDGTATRFALGDAGQSLLPGDWWRSPASGGRYPLTWQIDLPRWAIRLSVRPAFETQELTAGPGVPFPYWEGAVTVEGTLRGAAVKGTGYMELTGYAGTLNPFFE
ncbi:MAG: carotenoid 1,2-hydratase [Candidatus Lambdaproteobacteria bacterium]|nr:carotenoid 1,2-hydratase [Candidatus Lambdaproteobacteria bacterium]